MNHKQYIDAVSEYRQKSGHSVNYNTGVPQVPGDFYTGKREVQKGSLAKDKMRDIHSRADSKSNKSAKRMNVSGYVNDVK